MKAPPAGIPRRLARAIWLNAQRLDADAPFGRGAAATHAAVQHLGYVQIDTIHVIERCHHHILYTRIPDYRREHLDRAQAVDRSIFEYWTHALAYLPVEAFRYYVRDMRNGHRVRGGRWFSSVTASDLRRVLGRIRRDGALTIRDIDDDVLVEKSHPWASRKPSKRALQLAFFRGLVTISRRTGMLKSYELTTRHFGWERLPRMATQQETLDYLLDRALRSQGLVSLDSICYGVAGRRAVEHLIEARVCRGQLVAVDIQDVGKCRHWVRPETLDLRLEAGSERVHILSPFDPLVCQRRRLQLFFDYEHRFEAYLPAHRRVLGYFACPVLVGDRIVAALDLKADRAKGRLQVQKWTWMVGRRPRALRVAIETALHAFERFQLAP